MDNQNDQIGTWVDEVDQMTSSNKPSPPVMGETLNLVTRFLVGLIVMGGEELSERLKEFQIEYDDKIASGSVIEELEDESGLDTLRYLLIGAMLRSQKRAVQQVNTGVNFGFRVTSSMLKRFSVLSDNFLMRPMRRPVESKVKGWQEVTRVLVRDGRAAEENGRFLVEETVPGIIDDFVDYLAKSPQLAELIRTQIGEQSSSLAGVMVDNSRRLSVGADGVLEGVIRRLFRLTSREDLPGSPIRGKPQTMYMRESMDIMSKFEIGEIYDFSYDESTESMSLGEKQGKGDG